MYKKTTLALAGLVGLALSGGASAADVHTKTISATCLSCHGNAGKSMGAVPSLAGINKDHFVSIMNGFKSGSRVGTIMQKHAGGYTEAEIEAMGAYFASMK